MTRRRLRSLLITTAAAIPVLLSSCTTEAVDDSVVTLIAYDSFILPEDAFDAFTEETGIRVDVALGGDTGELAAKVALTSGNPEADVLWGVDNSLLSRLTEADAFDPYVSRAAPIEQSLIDAGDGIVTPVDYGYVCVNFDLDALRALGVDPPTNLDDLIRPEYRSMLVVPSATSSSPGLSFLLATAAAFPDSWQEYWQRLMDNDVAVADGWTDAYYTRFSHHGGDRPLVVSYSTSPPAEVLFADPPLPPDSPAPTGVAADTCFEQIEFAGVLRGTDRPRSARLLIDYLVGRSFQELLPENLFVYPANSEAELPGTFIAHTEPVKDPWRMDPREISRKRVELLEEWTRITGT